MSNKIPEAQLQHHCYILSADFNIDGLLSLLEAKYVCQLDAARKFRKIHYDTFDWRLYRQGEALALLEEGRKQKLSLENLSDGMVKTFAPMVSACQKIVGQTMSPLNIPPSALRESIASTAGIRALLPVVQIAGDRQMLLLRNKSDKLVMRLSIEQNGVVSGVHGRKADLPGMIVLNPVKGYWAELAHVEAMLDKVTSLEPCGVSRLDLVLQSLGRKACDYSSKIKLEIDPAAASGQAVKTILQHLLTTMETNEPGMLANWDSEFLHDFRVAVRRIRSLLTQMKKALPEDQFRFFKLEFAWLGEVTTPARDIDVYLLEFDKLQLSLPPQMQDALLPFKEFLQGRQQQAYQVLINAVNSMRYKKLKQTMQAFLNSSIESQCMPPAATKDIHGQADKRIWHIYRRVTTEAEQLNPDSPAGDYHELRKSCKKLRYLLEFFQHLYPEKHMAELIRQLKILQDNLGEFQDMDVQSHTLREFAHMMAAQGVHNADTFMAMGVLADGMEHKKVQLRHAFGDCYRQFSAKKYQKLFKQLFNSDLKPAQELAHESIG